MRRRFSFLSILLAAVLAATEGVAQVSAPVTASTAASEMFPEVTCTSTDAGLNADVLQIANDTRDQLEPLLQLGGSWRFPVHIVIVTPDDPLAAHVHQERIGVEATDKTMAIEAVLPADDPDAKAFIQRQFVTALLWEKFFATTKTFNARTQLDVVPLWLLEGLNEWITADPARDREAVVRRAALAQRAPTLEEITSWGEISDDRLLGLYQRSFCYYLVNSLVRQGPKRLDFQQWLATVAAGKGASAKFLFPTESGWQRQLLEAPERTHDIVYTWDESASALAAAETIGISAKKAADTRICTLDSVVAQKPDQELIEALNKKIFDLTALELRAHPSWRPIFASYRFGLVAVVNGHPEQAQKLIHQAQQLRTDEMAYHQKLGDYVNWFEVTKDYAGNKSRFDSYFSTARDMDQIQADPTHPNPIRTDLNQAESRL